jgi:hypothetical protein
VGVAKRNPRSSTPKACASPPSVGHFWRANPVNFSIAPKRETARIDALVAKVRDATDRLRELRTALISAAVTGKIDVRDEVAAGGLRGEAPPAGRAGEGYLRGHDSSFRQ